MSTDESPYYSELGGGFSIYQGSPNLNSATRSRGNPSRGPQQSHLHRGFDMHSADKSQRYAMDPIHQGFPASSEDTEKNRQKEKKKQEKGIMYLLSGYADKSSLNGVIFIKESKYYVAKVIWSILLIVAFVVMVLHLYELAKNYYSYEKQSNVNLKFENLQFPAVTFCNVNALKKSKKDMASDDLQDLIDTVDPDQMLDDVDEWDPEYEEEIEYYDENGDRIDDDEEVKKKRRKRDTSRKKKGGKKGSSVTVKSRKGNFFDDFNFTDYDDTDDDEFNEDTFSGSWESESEPAAFDKINKQFVTLYNKETGAVRQQMGHRIQDMLIQCSFSGRKCVQQNFTHVSSSTMGNCYTIQYNKFVSRQSGPSDGLSLMLYLEPHEYIPGITNAQGIKLVVHEPSTIPFPDDEGLAIGAGMETNVGLRRISITRLDEPWGECSSTSTFQDTYNIKYTRQTCQQICEMEEVAANCNCYDATKPVIYTLLKNRAELSPCQGKKKDVACMRTVSWEFDTNDTTCHCDSPCSEVVYRRTLSSKPWPHSSFAMLIAKTICKEKPNSDLCNGSNMDLMELRENFVKVNIYFETLNYEDLTEQEDYSEFQFISDIGGTVGLYVGLSVLSMFEVAHLVISIVKYLFVGKNE